MLAAAEAGACDKEQVGGERPLVCFLGWKLKVESPLCLLNSDWQEKNICEAGSLGLMTHGFSLYSFLPETAVSL